MKRTQEALGNLVTYQAVTAISPLEPPKVGKGDIPDLILCPNYQKAVAAIERQMERHNSRVDDANTELSSLREAVNRYEREAGRRVDRENPESVMRHNDAVDQYRRFSDRYNDTLQKHSDAIEAQKERLTELRAEAVTKIEDDIVSFLDRTFDIATRLAERDDSDDLVAAMESCFLALKVHHTVEDHLDNSVAREGARKRVGELNKTFLALCQHADARNALADLYRRNAYLGKKYRSLLTDCPGHRIGGSEGVGRGDPVRPASTGAKDKDRL